MRRAKPRSNRGSKKGKRKGALLLLTLLFIIIAVAYGIYWFLVLRHYEETDDAYVAGNQVQIMAQVAGSVTKVWADNTDYVQKGDPLVTLDRTDAQQAFEKAKTQLAASVRQTRQQMINSKQLQANIDVKKTALARAQADLNRRIPLGAANLIGREELQHARDTVASAQAELDVAIQQYNANRGDRAGHRGWNSSRRCSRRPLKCVTPGWPCSVRRSSARLAATFPVARYSPARRSAPPRR